MLRDWDDSGQVYEPKTVKSAYLVNCESTFAYLVLESDPFHE